jgi:hypothetical protein
LGNTISTISHLKKPGYLRISSYYYDILLHFN